MRKVRPDIKHCPYTTCGHHAVLIGYDIEDPHEETTTHYQVECETCCATGPLCDTEDAAIQEWNAIERHEPKLKKGQEPLDADKVLKEFRKTMDRAFDTFASKIGSDVRICPICGHEAKTTGWDAGWKEETIRCKACDDRIRAQQQKERECQP